MVFANGQKNNFLDVAIDRDIAHFGQVHEIFFFFSGYLGFRGNKQHDLQTYCCFVLRGVATLRHPSEVINDGRLATSHQVLCQCAIAHLR